MLDTLGRLAAHGHGLFGYCRICRRAFDVSMPALIAERGGGRPVIGMAPIPCPSCGGRRTEFRITAPSKGGRQLPADPPATGDQSPKVRSLREG